MSALKFLGNCVKRDPSTAGIGGSALLRSAAGESGLLELEHILLGSF